MFGPASRPPSSGGDGHSYSSRAATAHGGIPIEATKILIAALLLALGAALPATALAAPAGGAGGSQYTPSIPGAGGDLEERDFGGSDEQTDANLPDSVTDELESSGSSGATAAAAAAATSPDSEALDRAKERAASREAVEKLGAADRVDSPVSSAGLTPQAGDDRIGMLFPVALGLSLIAALLLLARRRFGR
jgi:hypothetical protein